MQISGPKCHDVGIKGYGSEDAKVLFVGIAPGRDEIKLSKPFVGKSGQLLNAVLKSVNLDRDDVYCTNLICYHNDAPTVEEQAQCRARLEKEILTRKPNIIFLMGKLACQAFTGRLLGGKSGARGAVIWSDKYQAYLIPTYHTAAVLHGLENRDSDGKEFIYDIYRDLKKIHDVLDWAPEAPQAKVTYTVLDYYHIDEAQAVLLNLPRNEPVALDVETYNPNVDEIDIWGDQLLSFTIATKDHGWVFPLELIEQIKATPLVWPDDIQWTFHNAQFDTQIIKKNLDIWLTVHEDTMLQSYSLDERGGVHGLKTLAREYLGAGFWEEDREKGKKRLQDVQREVLYEYNAKDAIYTARLSHIFRERQERDNVRGVYERILIPAVNAVKEIQYRGMRVNKKKHLRFSIEWGQLYLDLQEKLQADAYEAGWPQEDINLQSPQQITKFLFEVLSLPVGKRTKRGAPSSDIKELEKLRGMHPFVDGLMRFRHMARYYDTYITGLGNHIKEDSRVHPYVRIHGSRTGRWSYGDPPMQTIPQTYERDDVERDFNRTREMFIPTNKDYVLLEVDYGKGEIWCGQALSGDKRMLEDLMSGDYHSMVAADVLKKPLSEVSKADRLLMKHVTFGVMYWREARALSVDIKSSTLEAQIYIENWFKRYTEYKQWFDYTVADMLETGELVSPTGRKRRFFILDRGVREKKQAVNFPIQSALGDMTEQALIILHNKFKELELDAHVLLQVHDSLLFEVHRSVLPLVAKLVHDVMTQVMYKGFPRLPVEMSAGINWGKTKPFWDCAQENCFGNAHTCSSDLLRNRLSDLGLLPVESNELHQALV